MTGDAAQKSKAAPSFTYQGFRLHQRELEEWLWNQLQPDQPDRMFFFLVFYRDVGDLLCGSGSTDLPAHLWCRTFEPGIWWWQTLLCPPTFSLS
jgi:hypothetical protein